MQTHNKNITAKVQIKIDFLYYISTRNFILSLRVSSEKTFNVEFD